MLDSDVRTHTKTNVEVMLFKGHPTLVMEIVFSLLPENGREVLFTNPSARAGYDTRSIFKRSLTGFEFRVFLLLD